MIGWFVPVKSLRAQGFGWRASNTAYGSVPQKQENPNKRWPLLLVQKQASPAMMPACIHGVLSVYWETAHGPDTFSLEGCVFTHSHYLSSRSWREGESLGLRSYLDNFTVMGRQGGGREKERKKEWRNEKENWAHLYQILCRCPKTNYQLIPIN